MVEFKAFPKIESISKLWMTVTQKIHGSNAQILIEPCQSEWVPAECGYQAYNVFAGSRSRWLRPDDDNYGFASWVMGNREELIRTLGVGRHFGEWCGKGINTGEGLSSKMFVVFDWWKYDDREKYPYHPYLMDGVRVVPVLYQGKFSPEKIEEIMLDLKTNGSKLTPAGWYMNPEGIVVNMNGTLYKKVFHNEETAWKKPSVTRKNTVLPDVSHLLQPVRLEKLLSRDERYTRNYPDSMRDIFADYVKDLVAEGQIVGDDDEVKLIKRALGGKIFPFIKERMGD